MKLVALLLLFVVHPFQDDESVSFRIDAPAAVRQGQRFEISVAFDIEESWHIYAPTGTNTAQGMIETKFVLQLPKGFRRGGKMELPEPDIEGPFEVYKGKNVRLVQPLISEKGLKPGEYEIGASITFQPCNEEMCLPPRTEDVKILVQVE